MTSTKQTSLPTTQKGAKWMTIKRGDGLVTGYLEVWYSANIGRFVSIPGASRFLNADGTIEATDR